MKIGMGRRRLLPLFLLLLGVGGALLFLPSPSYYLEVKNGEGKVLSCWKISREGSFSISFRHSVNRGMVKESYRLLSGGGFYLQRAWFENYGAGMMDSLREGVTMREEGSSLRLDFPVEKMDQVSYACAGIADHVLEVEGRQIHLFEKWPYQRLVFSISSRKGSDCP